MMIIISQKMIIIIFLPVGYYSTNPPFAYLFSGADIMDVLAVQIQGRQCDPNHRSNNQKLCILLTEWTYVIQKTEYFCNQQ
jgi:hypothetical protein